MGGRGLQERARQEAGQDAVAALPPPAHAAEAAPAAGGRPHHAAQPLGAGWPRQAGLRKAAGRPSTLRSRALSVSALASVNLSWSFHCQQCALRQCAIRQEELHQGDLYSTAAVRVLGEFSSHLRHVQSACPDVLLCKQALHIVTGQQPSALSGSPGSGERGSGHLQHPMAQGLAALESLKASQRLAPARTPGHHDMNGAGLGRPRQQAIHIRSTSPGHRIIQKTPGSACCRPALTLHSRAPHCNAACT